MLEAPGIKRLYSVVLPATGALTLFGIYTWLAKHLLPFAIITWCFAAILVVLVMRVTLAYVSRSKANGDELLLVPGKITVYRPLTSADDLFRIYTISVDRKRIGNLRFGEALSVGSSPGVHKLTAAIDGVDVEAATWEVDLTDGCGVALLVEPTFASSALRRSAGEWLRFREPEQDEEF